MPVLVNRLTRRGRVAVCVSLAGLLLVAAGSMWRPKAQGRPGDPQSEVRVIDSTERPAVQDPDDRGSTYDWLESQAVRVTTRFATAIAITERVVDGDLETHLTSLSGTELATFKVDRVDQVNDVLEFSTPDGTEVRAAGRANLRQALDWANRQVYSLWKDQATSTSQLDWRDELMRRRGAPVRDLDAEIAEVRTDWTGGLSATAVREVRERRNPMNGPPSFVSRLSRDNADLGFSRWYANEQVLAWSFPGLTEGYLNPERLNKIGGWPFTPDMAWANVQSFAFYHFHTLMADRGFVAERGTLRDKLLNLVMPSVFANEPGCDGLHWLDRSVLRPCCDVHDWCYEKYGCNSSSWWQWWSSWACDACNSYAVFCFVTGGGPYQQSPY